MFGKICEWKRVRNNDGGGESFHANTGEKTGMEKKIIKECGNCHYGIVVDPFAPCNSKGGCYFRKEASGWKPMTNGDKFRRLSDRELAARLIAYRDSDKNATLDDIVAWLKEDAKDS